MKTLIKWLLEHGFKIDENYISESYVSAKCNIDNIDHCAYITHTRQGYKCEYCEWVSNNFGRHSTYPLTTRIKDVIDFLTNKII